VLETSLDIETAHKLTRAPEVRLVHTPTYDESNWTPTPTLWRERLSLTANNSRNVGCIPHNQNRAQLITAVSYSFDRMDPTKLSCLQITYKTN